jgi:flavodoxin
MVTKTTKKTTKTTKTTKKVVQKHVKQSQKVTPQKVLIAYYSRTDTTMRVAHDIALHLGADIIKIRDHKSRAGPIGWIFAGRDALKEKETIVSYRDVDFNKYNKLIIGTPVWAGNMAPAARTFIKELPVNKDMKVSVFATCGGNAGKTLSEMTSLLKKRTYPVASSAEFKIIGKQNKEGIHEGISVFASQVKK